VADRYSFVNITEKQSKQCQAEIHLALSKEAGVDPDYDEQQQVFAYTNNTKDSFLFEDYLASQHKLEIQEEEIKNLKKQLHDQELKYLKQVKLVHQGHSPLQAVYES
jgi:hypothetical protein